MGDAGRVGVTDKNKDAHPDDSYDEGSEVKEMFGKGGFVRMGAQGEDDGDRAGAGGHGKGDGIEKDVIDVGGRVGVCGLFLTLYCVIRGQQLEPHAADHDAAGELDDRDGDAEQFEDPAADEGGDGADGKAIKRHLF